MGNLFKDLAAGAFIYALNKGDELKYYEGSVVSVGKKRVDVPPLPKTSNGQLPTQMPIVRNVVDVTYSIDGKTYTDAVDITAPVFTTDKLGGIALVATSKDSIVNELHQTQQSVENYIAEAEKGLPKKKEQLKSCKALIAQLDTAYKEKQQTEERFSKIEAGQKELADKLDKILAKLGK